MDIETIKAAKRQCESEITAIINMFQKQSGCKVDGIRLLDVSRFASSPEVIVNMEVRINDV